MKTHLCYNLLLLLFWGFLPGKAISQNPPNCNFAVSVSGYVATASVPPGVLGCHTKIDWGDGCFHYFPGLTPSHVFASCGTFTVTYSIFFGNTCNESSVCTQTINITAPKADIATSIVEQQTDCGMQIKLRATITSTAGCAAANQPVTISGPFPGSNFTFCGGDFTLSGNNVSVTIPAAQINQAGGKTVELCLQPKSCVANISQDVTLTATANGMPLVTVVNEVYCENTVQQYTSVPLNWNITPKAACLSLTKTAMNANVGLGQPVQYQVTLTNTGTGSANHVLLTDNFPVGLTPSSLPSGANVSGNQINWTSGVVPAGGSLSYTLGFTYTDAIAMCGPDVISLSNCANAIACGVALGPVCATVNLTTSPLFASGSMNLLDIPGLPSSGSVNPIFLKVAPNAAIIVAANYVSHPDHFFKWVLAQDFPSMMASAWSLKSIAIYTPAPRCGMVLSLAPHPH